MGKLSLSATALEANEIQLMATGRGLPRLAGG